MNPDSETEQSSSRQLPIVDLPSPLRSLNWPRLLNPKAGYITSMNPKPATNLMTDNTDWIPAITMTDSGDFFGEPSMGYGVAFTPSAAEQWAIRKDFALRGELQAKWERDGSTMILYVREKAAS
jgi:hypothetical protein